MRLNNSLVPATRGNSDKSGRWESWDILSPVMVLDPMKIIYPAIALAARKTLLEQEPPSWWGK